MAERVTRNQAAAAVEEILITPRVLNAERYAALIEELGTLVRSAAAQSGALSAAAEELRVAQVLAARTLEELRTRSETLSRSVAMIDQRLARNESLLARASEQVQAAQEAASRAERLASVDFGAAEQRLGEAERGAAERLSRAGQDALDRVNERADHGMAVMESLVRDGAARAAANATEAASRASERAAERAATLAAEAVVRDVESRIRSEVEDRATTIRRALQEQAAGATASLDRAASDGLSKVEQAVEVGTERISSESASCIAVCADAGRDLASVVERAEALVRPETLEPVRTLARELGVGIEGAERLRTQLDEAVARAEEAREAMRQAAESMTAVGAPAAVSASPPAPPSASADGFDADAVSELERRSRAVLVATEDNLRGATMHAERLGAWLGQLLGHAQHAGAALEAMVRRAEAARTPDR